MPPVRLVLAAAALLAVSACTGGSEPSAGPSTPAPTPLSEFAIDTLSVARADFCSRVAPGAVEDALGGPSQAATTWSNGDRVRLAPGVDDVAHEYGCRWTAADGTTAQGWVFAPPVTPGQAARLGRTVAQADGCHRVADAPAFGRRSVAVHCDDGTTAFHGLFGDAWLSCSVTPGGTAGKRSVPGDGVDRTGRWCVSIAQAAAAPAA